MMTGWTEQLEADGGLVTIDAISGWAPWHDLPEWVRQVHVDQAPEAPWHWDVTFSGPKRKGYHVHLNISTGKAVLYDQERDDDLIAAAWTAARDCARRVAQQDPKQLRCGCRARPANRRPACAEGVDEIEACRNWRGAVDTYKQMD